MENQRPRIGKRALKNNNVGGFQKSYYVGDYYSFIIISRNYSYLCMNRQMIPWKGIKCLEKQTCLCGNCVCDRSGSTSQRH